MLSVEQAGVFMAILEINKAPSKRELNWFGLIMLAVAGAVGAAILLKAGALTAASIVWALGALIVAVYYAVRPLRWPMYLGWMHLFFPIGWTVSHLVMAVVYYLVLTPIGLVMRLVGYDPMKRKFDRAAKTYWVEHNPGRDPSRYFRQS